jgi:hypothetical protein
MSSLAHPSHFFHHLFCGCNFEDIDYQMALHGICALVEHIYYPGKVLLLNLLRIPWAIFLHYVSIFDGSGVVHKVLISMLTKILLFFNDEARLCWCCKKIFFYVLFLITKVDMLSTKLF